MRKTKILVVDDEKAVKRLFELRFRKEIINGLVEAFFAFSAVEALSILESHDANNFSFILADINMPEMSGLELLVALRARYPEKKIFMVTAYNDQGNRDRAMQLGATDYLVKPINFGELKEKMLLTETNT